MHARKNPDLKQALRRIRRHPACDNDPRYEKDAYWALRLQGFPHTYAKRALRDETPKITEQPATEVVDCDPGDLLFPIGTTFKKVEVQIRPLLNDETVVSSRQRSSEYTIWDERIPGFGLRIRKSGCKSFILLYRIRGEKRLRKITIGKAGGLDLDIARSMAREFLADARMGRDPVERFKHQPL